MEKQNLSENITNSSTVKEQLSKTSPQEKMLILNSELLHQTDVKFEKCNHSLKRVFVNRIECTKCGFGLIDSPEKPFVLTR